MHNKIAIFTDASLLRLELNEDFKNYYEKFGKEIFQRFYPTAKQLFNDSLESTISQVLNNYYSEDQDLLSKRNAQNKRKFIEELPRGSIAIFYPNPNIKNLFRNSKSITPLVICGCNAVPFRHFYKVTPNFNKGNCPLNIARCESLQALKSTYILIPQILLKAKKEDIDEIGRKRISDKSNKVELLCKICNSYKLTSASSFHKSILANTEWRCRTCSSKNARKINFNRRKKVSDVPELLESLSKNQNYPPDQISIGSSKKHLWTCIFCGNDYECEPRRRTFVSNCPCISRHMSVVQASLYCILIKIFKNDKKIKIISEFRALIDSPTDIVITTSPKLAIEYDGAYYHDKKKLASDLTKTQKLVNQGYLVIRIREPNCPAATAPQGSYFITPTSSEYNPEYFIEIISNISELNATPDAFKNAWSNFKKNKDNLNDSILGILLDTKNIQNHPLHVNNSLPSLKDEVPGIDLIWTDPENKPDHYKKGARGHGSLSFNNRTTLNYSKICSNDFCVCTKIDTTIHNFLKIVRQKGASGKCPQGIKLDIEPLTNNQVSTSLSKARTEPLTFGEYLLKKMVDKNLSENSLWKSTKLNRRKIGDWIKDVHIPSENEINILSAHLDLCMQEINKLLISGKNND